MSRLYKKKRKYVKSKCINFSNSASICTEIYRETLIYNIVSLPDLVQQSLNINIMEKSIKKTEL